VLCYARSNFRGILRWIPYFREPIIYISEVIVISIAESAAELISNDILLTVTFATLIVIGLVVFNIGMGLRKVLRSQKLASRLAMDLPATVVRDGKEREINASDLVIGDITILKEGQLSPAFVKVNELSQLGAILTC
jgi:magnesium-transporting ATPase (P-type)